MIRAGRGMVVSLVVLAMTGCDDVGLGPGEGVPVTLSLAVEPRGGLAGSLEPGLTLALAAETLELESVELIVDELVLEREDGDGTADSDGDSEADSDSDGGANEKFEIEGTTIELPLNGEVVTPLSETVPAGLYEELEIDIAVVRLTGFVDGEAFDVVVPVDLELEIEFEPPLEVDGTEPFNITITVDPLAWFENDDGTFIDPRDLSTDEALMNTVRQRMAVSFDAFEDSDHDADSDDSDSDGDTDGS